MKIRDVNGDTELRGSKINNPFEQPEYSISDILEMLSPQKNTGEKPDGKKAIRKINRDVLRRLMIPGAALQFPKESFLKKWLGQGE